MLAITIAHCLTGTASVSTRYLIAWLEPVEVAFLRYFLGGLFILPLGLILHKSVKSAQPYIIKSILLGILFFALFPFLFSAAFKYTTAARGALVIATMPLWSILIGHFTKHETITAPLLTGILITIIGLAWALQDKLLGPAQAVTSFTGELYMLAAAMIGAIYSNIAESALKNTHASQFTPVAMLAGCIVLSPWALSSHVIRDLHTLDMLQLGVVLYLGCIAGGIAFYLFNWVLNKSTATMATLFVTLHPLTAIFLAWLLLDEHITSSFFIGTGIVFAGLIITQWPRIFSPA